MPDDSIPAAPRLAPCPICGKPGGARHRPFCSKRCADVDLARWLGERYSIPGAPVLPDSEDDTD